MHLAIVEGLDEQLLFLNFINLDLCIITKSESGELTGIEMIAD